MLDDGPIVEYIFFFEVCDDMISYSVRTLFVIIFRIFSSVFMSMMNNRLKKPFSRLDFQQNPEYFGGNAMRATTAFLPKFATDIYYRDEIGNISTSMIRYQDEGVLV